MLQVLSAENLVSSGQDLLQGQRSLALTRAEKLVAVNPAAKVANNNIDTISWEEKEMELMCTAVDESQFGHALVLHSVLCTVLKYS